MTHLAVPHLKKFPVDSIASIFQNKRTNFIETSNREIISKKVHKNILRNSNFLFSSAY